MKGTLDLHNKNLFKITPVKKMTGSEIELFRKLPYPWFVCIFEQIFTYLMKYSILAPLMINIFCSFSSQNYGLFCDFVFENWKAKCFIKQKWVGFVIRIDFGLLRYPILHLASVGINISFVFSRTTFLSSSLITFLRQNSKYSRLILSIY